MSRGPAQLLARGSIGRAMRWWLRQRRIASRMWRANTVGQTVDVVAVADRLIADVEHRLLGRKLECKHVRVSDVLDVYGRDEMGAVAGNDEFAAPDLLDRSLLER